MKAFIHKYLFHLTLVGIFVCAFLLRCYRLDEIPNIIHVDEAGLGYNAWCIANYGVDRHLNQMPFYPQNFDTSGQSPLYTYSLVLLILTIGKGNLSLLLARIPGLISSMIVVIVGTKNMSLIFQNKKITLMSALLLTICPYYIMYGRFAIDCNLMLGCSTIALYFLTKYVQTQKISQLVLCGVSFGFTLYSYVVSYFFVPIFLVIFTLYMLYTGKITFRRGVLFATCVSVLAVPVILFACSLLFQLEPFRFLGFTIAPIATERVKDVANANFFDNIVDIIKITLTQDGYPFNSVSKFYTLYVTSIPFIIIGFFTSAKTVFVSLKNRCFHYSSIYWIFYVCGLLTTGITRSHNIYRANYFYIAYLYLLVSGIYAAYHFVRSYRYFFISILGACYLMWGLSFIRYYFTLYSPADNYTSLYIPPYAEAITDAHSLENVNDIYIDSFELEEYLNFFFPASPYEVGPERLEENYGRYHFDIDYETPIDTHNAYIVRKENNSFIRKLVLSGITYQRIEYSNYYLYYFN